MLLKSARFLGYVGTRGYSPVLPPTPYTLHPTPYSPSGLPSWEELGVGPYTLHPTPYTLSPSIPDPLTVHRLWVS